jgi:hypothetical protein
LVHWYFVVGLVPDISNRQSNLSRCSDTLFLFFAVVSGGRDPLVFLVGNDGISTACG